MEEFKIRKQELSESVKKILLPSLSQKEITFEESKFNYNVTVQGGVGCSSEQEFLMRNYKVKSVGWGSPFLLVPEVMNVDNDTLEKLSKAGEDDLYLSDISPLGVPFNNLRNNQKDLEKIERIERNKPGSPCPKKFLQSNKEYSEKPLCTASITFLNKKISDLKEKLINQDEYNKEYSKIVDKVCLCEGLTSSVLKVNQIETPKQSREVAVCPVRILPIFQKLFHLKRWLIIYMAEKILLQIQIARIFLLKN